MFLIFNRPDLTRQVFPVIRDAQPSRLYIATDGPRQDNSKDIYEHMFQKQPKLIPKPMPLQACSSRKTSACEDVKGMGGGLRYLNRA